MKTISRHLGHCPYTGKASYHNRADAKTTARYYGKKARPFRCDPGCGLWHLGTTAPGEPRQNHRTIHATKVRDIPWETNR